MSGDAAIDRRRDRKRWRPASRRLVEKSYFSRAYRNAPLKPNGEYWL